MTRSWMVAGGRAGLAAAITGVASAVLMLAWPEQVAPGVVHYPFSLSAFYVIQTWFCVHHLIMVVALVGLGRSGAVGSSRLGRFGAWLAAAGMVGLSGAEIFAMRFAETSFDAANQGVMGAAYAISGNLIGLGTVLAGIAVLRAKVWTGWWRWTPLLIGLWHFLVLTPSLFMGFVAARFGIGSWIVLFGALGLGLLREARRLPEPAP